MEDEVINQGIQITTREKDYKRVTHLEPSKGNATLLIHSS